MYLLLKLALSLFHQYLKQHAPTDAAHCIVLKQGYFWPTANTAFTSIIAHIQTLQNPIVHVTLDANVFAHVSESRPSHISAAFLITHLEVVWSHLTA